jgi:hypothetical protein
MALVLSNNTLSFDFPMELYYCRSYELVNKSLLSSLLLKRFIIQCEFDIFRITNILYFQYVRITKHIFIEHLLNNEIDVTQYFTNNQFVLRYMIDHLHMYHGFQPYIPKQCFIRHEVHIDIINYIDKQVLKNHKWCMKYDRKHKSISIMDMDTVHHITDRSDELGELLAIVSGKSTKTFLEVEMKYNHVINKTYKTYFAIAGYSETSFHDYENDCNIHDGYLSFGINDVIIQINDDYYSDVYCECNVKCDCNDARKSSIPNSDYSIVLRCETDDYHDDDDDYIENYMIYNTIDKKCYITQIAIDSCLHLLFEQLFDIRIILDSNKVSIYKSKTIEDMISKKINNNNIYIHSTQVINETQVLSTCNKLGSNKYVDMMIDTKNIIYTYSNGINKIVSTYNNSTGQGNIKSINITSNKKELDINLNKDGSYTIVTTDKHNLTPEGNLIVWKGGYTIGTNIPCVMKLIIHQKSKLIQNTEGTKFRTNKVHIDSIIKYNFYKCYNSDCKSCGIYLCESRLFCKKHAFELFRLGFIVNIMNIEEHGTHIDTCRAPFREYIYNTNQIVDIPGFKNERSSCNKAGCYFFLTFAEVPDYVFGKDNHIIQTIIYKPISRVEEKKTDNRETRDNNEIQQEYGDRKIEIKDNDEIQQEQTEHSNDEQQNKEIIEMQPLYRRPTTYTKRGEQTKKCPSGDASCVIN